MPVAPFLGATTDDKNLALDNAWDAALEGANTLPAAMRLLRSTADAFSSAGALKTQSSNGHLSTAFDPGLGALPAIVQVRVWTELLALYQECILWIMNPSPDWWGWDGSGGCVPTSFTYVARDTYQVVTVSLPQAAPNDDMVDGLMRNALVPVTERQSDYSSLRVPPYGWGGGAWI